MATSVQIDRFSWAEVQTKQFWINIWEIPVFVGGEGFEPPTR
jgi:hypothetical protein